MKKIVITSIGVIALMLSTTSHASCYGGSDGRTFCEKTYSIPSGNIETRVTISCGGGKKMLGYMFGYPDTAPAGYPGSGIAPIKAWGKNTGFTKSSWTLYLANGAGHNRPPYPLSITAVCR